MALKVIEKDSKVTGERSATVVLEGDTPTEVSARDAKTLALRHASTMGISRPGLDIGGVSYRVNENGEVAQACGPNDKYRFDYRIQGGL